MTSFDELTAPYRQVVELADAFFERTQARHPGQMRCGDGCSLCCQQELEVLLVEAIVLLAALQREPASRRANLGGEHGCALLVDDRCALYAARPLICRTHGLPIRQGSPTDLARQRAPAAASTASISCCELNFLAGFPADAVLDGTRLHGALVIADAMVRRALGVDAPHRVSIRALVERGVDALDALDVLYPGLRRRLTTLQAGIL